MQIEPEVAEALKNKGNIMNLHPHCRTWVPTVSLSELINQKWRLLSAPAMSLVVSTLLRTVNRPTTRQRLFLPSPVNDNNGTLCMSLFLSSAGLTVVYSVGSVSFLDPSRRKLIC